MKRNISGSTILLIFLILSFGLLMVSAKPPPRTVLSVTITSPQDDYVVANGETFIVMGNVLAKRGDAGWVDTYVQYAIGEGSTAFANLGYDPSVLHIVTESQPQSQSLLKDESYDVQWTLAGPSGIYEIRIYSEGEQAKSGESEAVTVKIQGPGPPPGAYFATSEEQDPTTGYGRATGSFEDTYYVDGTKEILAEEKNPQGTKKPTDDTTELGWIYRFENLPTTRASTMFYLFGYAEFLEDDSDTSFLVQEWTIMGWNTILEISHTGVNKLFSTPITDNDAETLELRIVDNDRTVGNKQLSSLYIDQLLIGVDDFQPPTSGIEILLPPYRCHHFQAWEHYGNNWYHSADVPILTSGATDIEIADLDLDGNNEVVVAELISETHGVGLIEIFDFDLGPYPVETLVLPEPFDTAVMSIAVGNFDGDPEPEIAAAAVRGGAVIWDKVDGEYQIGFTLYEASYMDLVAAGNLDTDPELELAFAVSLDPVLCEVALYDFVEGTWLNTANYSTSTPNSFFEHMEINDIDQNGVGELYVMYKDDPFYILTYTGDQLVPFGSVPDVIVGTDVGFSFITGHLDTNGAMDIVFYTPFIDGSTEGFLVYEYTEAGFVFKYNIRNPGMGGVFGDQMALGDIDGDGANELVVSNGPGGIYSEGRMYIFRNDVLIFMADLGVNDSNCVAIGDYDND